MQTRNGTRRTARRPAEAVLDDVTVTLLFCDVVRSTELTRRLGDRGAYGVIRSFHRVVLRASACTQGEQLELRGDGVLLAFGEPQHALGCAVEIQRRLRDGPKRLRVDTRIGIHTGPALRVTNGYFGGTVVLSARIAAEAAPGEILVSAALVRAVAPADLPVDAGRWVVLKGVPEPHLVFSLPWRANGAPGLEPRPPSPAPEPLRMVLDRTCESDLHDEALCMLARRSAV